MFPTVAKLEFIGVAGDKVYAALAAKRILGWEDKPGSLVNEYHFVYSFGSYLFNVGVHLNTIITLLEAAGIEGGYLCCLQLCIEGILDLILDRVSII